MIFNQHSYVFSSAFLIALVALLSLGQGVTMRGVVATGMAVLVLLIVWLATRTGNSTLGTAVEVEQVLTNGTPTFVQFYSNY